MMRASVSRLLPNVQLRAQFQSHGFVVIERFLDAAAVASLRGGVKKGVEERAEHFLACPKTLDILKQERETADPDPLYSKFVQRFKEVSKRKAAERKKKRAAIRAAKRGLDPAPPASIATDVAKPPPKLVKDATGDDVLDMARRIAQQLVKTPAVHSSVYNDPVRLKAINTHKCNVWMTSDAVKAHAFGSVGKAIGEVASQVAGVPRPVLFGDRPMLRDTFYKPTLLHCGAPFMGVEQFYRRDDSCNVNDEGNALLACVAWLFMDDSERLRSPFWYVDNSHTLVAEELRKGVRSGVDVRRLTNLFPPVDSDISLWLQHFPTLQSSGTAKELMIRAGSLVLADPHLLMGLGPNFGRNQHVSLQCLVVSSESKPSIHPASWVREWKSTSKGVDFKNEVIFPRLFT
jgi:hypothetical protein